MKFFLTVLLLLVCCKQGNFNKNNNVVTDRTISVSDDPKINDAQSHNDDKKLYQYDPLYNKIFILKFYDNYMRFDKGKDLTLVRNYPDTSIAFNFLVKNNRHSRKLEKYFNDNNSLLSKVNNINHSAFYLEEIKSLGENIYLGIFVEYFGFERKLYAYGELNTVDNNLNIENLYCSLDRTGIGKISYDQIIKLDDGSYCIVGNNKSEGHQSISLHFFTSDCKNKTYIIEKCSTSSEANPHDEKLEYKMDYKNKIITIEKFEMDRDKETDWHKISSNSYNILDLAGRFRK